MKILVIQKKRIGDVLISTILLEALRKKFPEAELHYLIYPNSLAVVENSPFIDRLIILDSETKKSILKMIGFLFRLRKEKYNIVVDAYAKPNSVLMGWFSGAKKTITFDKTYSRIFYSDVVERRKNTLTNATMGIEHRMQLLEILDIEFQEYKPKIFLKEEEINFAKLTLLNNGIDLDIPTIMISAIGSNALKTYPLLFMAEILDKIVQNHPVQLLFNYIPNQKNQALELIQLCKPETQKQIFFDIYENDLRKFIALTSQCKALIGNEGGSTHMAKAIGIPNFIIFAIGVEKIGWSTYENETTNVAVHINDYIDASRFNLNELTEKFTPKMIENKLESFLNFNIKK